MTMPRTAALLQENDVLGLSPSEMSDEQLEQAVMTLRDDLLGDPISFIAMVAPESEVCECGAIHLMVNDHRLGPNTKQSLLRMLATPFGDIVREHFKRASGYKDIRFGWQGVEEQSPRFWQTVKECGVQQTNAADIPHGDLRHVIEAIRLDMPGIMPVIEQAAKTEQPVSVKPDPDGDEAWQEMVHQLMFTFATPLRKYVVEWCKREYNGVHVGAVNCCRAMVGAADMDEDEWKRAHMADQVSQQITPDC